MWNPSHHKMKSAGDLVSFKRHINTPTLFNLLIHISRDFNYVNGYGIALGAGRKPISVNNQWIFTTLSSVVHYVMSY